MVAEVFAGLGAIKTAFDIAKGLKDIDDVARRNAAIIELQEKILTAQAAQAALVETVSELKKRVAELESWEADKQRYKLTEIAPGIVCYTVKEAMRGGEPPHRICANCYAAGKKSFLQQDIRGPYYDRFNCHACGATLSIDKGTPPQRYAARSPYED
jgi:hypothetical protein